MSNNKKAEWVKEKITNTSTNVEIVKDNILSIEREGKGKFLVATMSERIINEEVIKTTVSGKSVDFVVNISKEPYITKGALDFAERNNFSIGGMGDIASALNDGNLNCYLNKEIAFVSRGLLQHSRVKSISRLDNRRFRITRIDLEPVTVVSINEYEITADVVRETKDNFPPFDAILKSNPNGRITSEARRAAESSGLYIYKWGELMGALNKKW